MTDHERLAHMLRYARKAIRVLGAVDLDRFIKDETLMLAIERAVEIVGEAASQMDRARHAEFTDVPWRDIIGMRHVLAPGYASIDHAILYRVVREDLPPLIASLERLLGETPE